MQAVNLQTAAATSAICKSEPIKFAKRIGSTEYFVTVRCSETSKQTLEDKIFRLIERDIANVKV